MYKSEHFVLKFSRRFPLFFLWILITGSIKNDFFQLVLKTCFITTDVQIRTFFVIFASPRFSFRCFASTTPSSTVTRTEGTVGHPNVFEPTRFDGHLSSWYSLVKGPSASPTLAPACGARIENLTSVAGVSIDLLSIICDQFGSRLFRSVTLGFNNATLGPNSTYGVSRCRFLLHRSTNRWFRDITV